MDVCDWDFLIFTHFKEYSVPLLLATESWNKTRRTYFSQILLFFTEWSWQSVLLHPQRLPGWIMLYKHVSLVLSLRGEQVSNLGQASPAFFPPRVSHFWPYLPHSSCCKRKLFKKTKIPKTQPNKRNPKPNKTKPKKTLIQKGDF